MQTNRVICPSCGKKNWPGEVYCNKCSGNLSLRDYLREKNQKHLILL
jgi:uncharacterized OB-fold protein